MPDGLSAFGRDAAASRNLSRARPKYPSLDHRDLTDHFFRRVAEQPLSCLVHRDGAIAEAAAWAVECTVSEALGRLELRVGVPHRFMNPDG